MLIFYDVDTQRDFMDKKGALYVPGAESIRFLLKEITARAVKNNMPVLGSVDRHFGTLDYKFREAELSKYGGPFPDHCMKDTPGELKIPETVMEAVADLSGLKFDRSADAGIYIAHPLPNRFERVEDVNEAREWTGKLESAVKALTDPTARRPVYIEKQSYDVFTNPAIGYVLKDAGVDAALVYGVATDFCVKAAVLGMQQRQIDCYVVEDAIRGVFPDGTKVALDEMIKAGAKLVKFDDLENIIQTLKGGKR